MRKYEPLGRYLSKLDKTIVTLTFSEIEEIINDALPQSAIEHMEEWWANDESTTHYQSIDGWLSVGWKVVNKNRKRREITFKRLGS